MRPGHDCTGGFQGLGNVLTAVNINTNEVLGSLNLYTLMGDGSMSFGRQALNQTTGEMVFANLHYDKFLIVNGPAMTGLLHTVTNSRGRAPAWNPAEHKLYITTIAWNGYFIYDADTAASSVTSCVNDGTRTFYSQATNRMYHVGRDRPQDDDHRWRHGCLPERHASRGWPHRRRLRQCQAQRILAGTSGTYVLDENTMTVVTSFPGSGGSGATLSKVLVDQAHRRVFVMNNWSLPSQNSSIVAIDDGGGARQDFTGDRKSDMLWHHATARRAVAVADGRRGADGGNLPADRRRYRITEISGHGRFRRQRHRRSAVAQQDHGPRLHLADERHDGPVGKLRGDGGHGL